MKAIAVLTLLIGFVLLGAFMVIAPQQSVPMMLVALPFAGISVALLIHSNNTRRRAQRLVEEVNTDKEALSRQLRKLEQSQREQFERVRQYNQELAVAAGKEEILLIIVRTLGKMTRSASGDSQLFLLSHLPGSDEFVYEVAHNFDSTMLRAERFNTADELLSIVIGTRQIHTVISDMFGADSPAQYFIREDRMSALSQVNSLVLFPLILEGEVWGIVVVFCCEEAATRVRQQLDFFTLLMGQSAVGLGSAIHRGLSSLDRLTQLYNRGFLHKRAREEMELCNRQRLPLSVLIIDIDHFKAINDSYGHQEGDMVLKTIAQIITKNVRLTDVCARYGGEEFVVILPGIEEKESDRFSIAARLRAAIEKTEFFVLDNKLLHITVSIGVAVRHYPQDQKISWEELFERADKLLYAAKRGGRNRVCYPAVASDAATQE